jgi:predicted aspartyl protease
MGLTVIEVEVANPSRPRRCEAIEFLVDSGAIYSVVPAARLRRLGIRPISAEEFRLGDGSKIVRKKGVALFRLGERVGGADVIFGEENDSTLLGALTLEALGLVLDPPKRVLRPLPMVLAHFDPIGWTDKELPSLAGRGARGIGLLRSVTTDPRAVADA